MTTHNGKPIYQRGGADAGRGDDAHGITESWRVPISNPRSEVRGMTKDTLAQAQQGGYSHPTGPTTMLGAEGANIARNSYRQQRTQGVAPQEARSMAIAHGVTGGRDSSPGAQGYGSK